MPSAPRQESLTPIQRALFSLGTFGSAGPNTIVVQLQLYFTKYLGYPASVISNVRGFSIIFDAVTDPLMGYISDHTESRFGRRMPYIAIGALFYAVGVIGMWFAPAGLSLWQFYLFLIAMQVIFTIGVTMTSVPYYALIPELAREYRVRTTLVSWMQAGTYLGTTWGALVRRYGEWRGDEIRGFQEFAVLCSIVMIASYAVIVLFVKEPPLSAEQHALLAARRRDARAYLTKHIRGLGHSLGFALRDRHFLTLFLTVFTYQAGVLAGLWMYTFLLDDWFGKTWNTPFAQQYLTGPLSVFRDAFFLYIFFAIGFGVFCLPVWNWIGKHLEKRTCLLIGILGIGLTYGSSFWLFAPKSFPLLILYCLFQAFFYCAANIFPASMLADIATHSEWQRGEANEGMFYGANSFLMKLYNAAAIFWTGFALDHIVHYRPGEDAVQTAETLFRMRVLYAAPATVAALFAVFILLRYDLGRQKMAEVAEALRRRSEESAGSDE
ncbi:MAG: MFS transporter [Candidatus Hydrogenedentes bacterium]|nr:MFS transporter [Candidatus Hydrogenedentota bacterium]